MPRHGENIYKRKDGRWEARYVKEIKLDGSKKYGSVYGRSYAEVKDKQQLYLMHPTVIQSKVKNQTVYSILTEWLGTIKNYIKHSTYIKYENIINKHILDTIGNIPIRLVNSVTLQKFTDNRLKYKSNEKQLSKTTVNNVLIVIGMGFKYAKEEYGISCPKIHLLRLPKKEMDVLSISEQKQLVQYLLKENDIFSFGILLSLYTGIRIGELCALQWEDVSENKIKICKTMQRIKTDSGKTEILITDPKTEKSNRFVPIPNFLLPLINYYRKPSGYVIQQKNGKFTEPRLMQLKFSKKIAGCVIDDTHFHTLRHTFATRCIESGMDIKTLSEILGHTDVKTTLNRYVHSSFDLKQSSIDKLPFNTVI